MKVFLVPLDNHQQGGTITKRHSTRTFERALSDLGFSFLGFRASPCCRRIDHFFSWASHGRHQPGTVSVEMRAYGERNISHIAGLARLFEDG